MNEGASMEVGIELGINRGQELVEELEGAWPAP
jgi:hypothetical protein